MSCHSLFIIIYMCVCVCVCYEQYPVDNGSCAAHTTQGACEDKHSLFDADQELCTWHTVVVTAGEARDYFPCKYVHPTVSFQV